MKKYYWLGVLVFNSYLLSAQISGTVFRDFNANGVKDNTSTYNEPFVSGITVTAYPSSGAVMSTTTNSSGAYFFTGLTLPVRIEFSNLPASEYSAPFGSSNNTSVQFYTSSTTSANFGINYPGDFCHTTNPEVAVPIYVNGNSQVSGTAQSQAALFRFPYDNGTVNSMANAGNTGSVWGAAYQRSSGKLFTAAFGKRHASWGPLGENGLYVTTNAQTATGTANTTSFVDLNSINSSFDAGSVVRNFSPGEGSATSANYDENIFPLVGKIGMGDVEISEDGNYLYVINLNDRKLWRVQIGQDGTAPSSATQIVPYADFPNPCTNSTFRPFALKVYKGDIYIGGVCDGVNSSNNSVNRNNLQAVVYKVSESATPGGASYTEVLSFPLTYNRSIAVNNGEPGGSATTPYEDPNGTISSLSNGSWHPWARNLSDITLVNSTKVMAPQPLLSDIEFDTDGSMIIAFMDLTGHQGGNLNYGTTVGNTTTYLHTGCGDIMRAYNNNSTYELENAGSVGGVTSSGNSNGDGPGGGEFYFHDNFLHTSPAPFGVNINNANHDETSVGALALLPGKENVLNTVFDPLLLPSSQFWGYQNGGIRWYSNTDGRAEDALTLYLMNSSTNIPSYHFGKANGIGDIELLCSLAPLEIGNRVWMDTDNDGAQDPDEMGLDGIVVKLFSGSTQIATTTTANGGEYYFNTSYGLLPNTSYTIRIEAANIPSGKSVTLKDQPTGGVQDLGDNDASLVGTNADITYTTGNAGENNHTLDFRFKSAATYTVSVTATPGVCNSSTNQYTLTGSITFSNAPSTGTMTVSVSGGGNQVFNAPFTSPQSYSISGLTADGVSHTVTVSFSADATCTANTTYTAPAACNGCQPIPCGTTMFKKINFYSHNLFS